MAKKRMFSIYVIDTDAFLDMPLSAQALYFHLNMRADDDGFIGNPKRVMRLIGAADDDLKLLIAKRFVIQFEDGVIVIKHWRMHNTIRFDRHTPTVYTDELARLSVKENKAYTFADDGHSGNQMATKWQPTVAADIGIDIDKDSDIDKGLDIDSDKALDTENREDIDLSNNTYSCSSQRGVCQTQKGMETRKANELFEYLWNLYPKKRGKGNVSATQKKKLLKIGKEPMEQAIRNYMHDIEINGTDMKYVKNGSSFFNSGYVDYLPENYVSYPTARTGKRYQSTAEYMEATKGWSDGITDDDNS